MNTPARTPRLEPSNEATVDQLETARAQGDAYADALYAMREESGAVIHRAGDYVVALIQEDAEGMYGPDETGQLVWHEAAEDANGHLEVAVADAADGRFVPGLDVTLTLSRNDQVLFSTRMPFLWHPFIHHYGTNIRMPDEGEYTATVHIGSPFYMRHDPVNGKRYDGSVEVVFTGVAFKPGRKPSPEAQPRGTDAPYAGATVERTQQYD